MKILNFLALLISLILLSQYSLGATYTLSKYNKIQSGQKSLYSSNSTNLTSNLNYNLPYKNTHLIIPKMIISLSKLHNGDSSVFDQWKLSINLLKIDGAQLSIIIGAATGIAQISIIYLVIEDQFSNLHTAYLQFTSSNLAISSGVRFQVFDYEFATEMPGTNISLNQANNKFINSLIGWKISTPDESFPIDISINTAYLNNTHYSITLMTQKSGLWSNVVIQLTYINIQKYSSSNIIFLNQALEFNPAMNQIPIDLKTLLILNYNIKFSISDQFNNMNSTDNSFPIKGFTTTNSSIINMYGTYLSTNQTMKYQLGQLTSIRVNYITFFTFTEDNLNTLWNIDNSSENLTTIIIVSGALITAILVFLYLKFNVFVRRIIPQYRRRALSYQTFT